MRAILFTTLLMAAGFAGADPEIEEKAVAVSVMEVFVPGDLVTNKDAYIVVTGLFPNSCYRWEGAKVTDESPNVHVVQAIAMVKQGICLRVLVPFAKEISLGKLVAGTHSVRLVSDDGTSFEKQLLVKNP